MEARASVSPNSRWDFPLEFNNTELNTNRFLSDHPNKKIQLSDGFTTATFQFFKGFHRAGIFSMWQITYKCESNF